VQQRPEEEISNFKKTVSRKLLFAKTYF